MPSSRRGKRRQCRVSRACELLEASGSHESLKAEPCTRAGIGADLTRAIAEVYEVSDGAGGSPWVHVELVDGPTTRGRHQGSPSYAPVRPGEALQVALENHGHCRQTRAGGLWPGHAALPSGDPDRR